MKRTGLVLLLALLLGSVADLTSVAQAATGDLPFQNGRFLVGVTWRTTDGTTGIGHGTALPGDSGYFWFFDPVNVELIVKVLDGCGVNQHFWVFAGGLTNVNAVITVTDTRTGAVKTYTNPQSTPFKPVQDTSAFACP
jgi:hypothetical protein